MISEFEMQRPHCPVDRTVALGILLLNLTLLYWLVREKLSVVRTSMFSNQIDPFNLSGCPTRLAAYIYWAPKHNLLWCKVSFIILVIPNHISLAKTEL